MQKFRLDWNYHSNAIEGNTLTSGETRAFLLYGLTAKGKPFKDYVDIKGHNLGIDFVLDLLKGKSELTEAYIRALHEEILVEPYPIKAITPDGKETVKHIQLGVYKRLPNHVRTVTGEIHYYASPEETPIKMQELLEWYRKTKEETNIHPLIFASIFHHRFVAIHPFDDGNGRLARLLMNFILMQYGYPPVVIKQEDRNAYYLALNQADGQELSPLITFIGEELLHSLELYLKGAKGEPLEEPDDLDKELALFKKELDGNSGKITQKWSIENQQNIVKNSLLPLLAGLENTFNKFKDMFIYFERKEIGNASERSITFAFQFNAFKYLQNNNKTPFGIEIKAHVVFADLQYKVYLTIDDYMELGKYVQQPMGQQVFTAEFNEYVLPKPAVVNFYHQLLSGQEIDNICRDLGKKMLTYIKKKSENNHQL